MDALFSNTLSMIPSNKTFIKNIFHKGGNNSLYLKKEDIPSNASLIILDIAAATRGILIQASLIQDIFSNHTKYEPLSSNKQ